MGSYFGQMALARDSMIPMMGNPNAVQQGMAGALSLAQLLQNTQQQRQAFPGEMQLQQQRIQANQMALAQAAQQKQDEQSFRQSLLRNNGDWGKALQDISGQVSPSFQQAALSQFANAQSQLAKWNADQRADFKDKHDRALSVYNSLAALQGPAFASALPTAQQALAGIDPRYARMIQPNMTPDQLRGGLGLTLGVQGKMLTLKPGEQTGTVSPTGQFTPTYTAPVKAPTPVPGRDIPFPPAVEAQRERIAAKGRSTMFSADQADAKDVAQAIFDGHATPVLSSYSFRDRTAIAAQLQRMGYNQAQAEQDYKAVQKHLSTMNGAQQLRLGQSISSASDMLDKIDDLYSQWKQLAPVSGYRVLNKATLATMKNLPGRAGAVATALDAQIADLTADLGNVYMGGNSPTDHALELAGKNLSSNWNQETFEEGIKQARLNLKIRSNSIRNSQAAGVSPGSPYMPNQQGPQQSAPANPNDPLGILPRGR